MQVRSVNQSEQQPHRGYGRRTAGGRALMLFLEIVAVGILFAGLINGVPAHTHTIYGTSVGVAPHSDTATIGPTRH